MAKLQSQAKSTPNPTHLKVPLSGASSSAGGAMILADESANKSSRQPSTSRAQIQPAIPAEEEIPVKTTNPLSSRQRQQSNAPFPGDAFPARVEGMGATASIRLAPHNLAQSKSPKPSVGPAPMVKPPVSAYCKTLARKGRSETQRTTVSEPATKPGPASPSRTKPSPSTGKVNAPMTAAEAVKKPAPKHVEGAIDSDPDDEELLRRTAAVYADWPPPGGE